MVDKQPIRVMLVDDHAMVRLGLATMLRLIDGLELVGEAGDGDEAIHLCAQLEPDIVLMDMLMPKIDGTTATRVIRHQNPLTRIIALTSVATDELIQGALEAGAVGYLLKDVNTEELALAIRAVASGLDALSPAAVSALLRHKVVPTPEQNNMLTAREKEVLALMVNGYGNAEIARELVVSPTTVKSHVSNILSKLNVSSRTEAVAFALRHRLIV
jgi:NarL family two-component system response regulator LiaR